MVMVRLGLGISRVTVSCSSTCTVPTYISLVVDLGFAYFGKG